MMQLPRTRAAAIVAALLATAGIGAAAGAGTYALFADKGTTVVRQVTVQGSQPASETKLSIPSIYDLAYKGVVELTATGATPAPFGGQEQQQAQGSGWVYDSDGHIVTNQHVVANANSLSVHFWNGATYPATVVGTDRSTDLAVIKVDAPSSLLYPLKVGNSEALEVGDGVVAIGSPFGLEGTVTSGIVSALHREMKAPNNFTITDSIQTDAAINHGNSGGPLLNAEGKVIGVNAQIESDSGGNDGVGFAIPSNTVASIVPRLISNGKVVHAYLGVQIEPIPQGVAQQLKMAPGVEVTDVRAGTPADSAGLHAQSGSRTVEGESYPTGGDVITSFDGKQITTAQQLQDAVDAKQPGDTVAITYVRGGKRRTVNVTLASRPS
ncbi:MAG: PDZ domain-containing protein [Actinobacteria bacterium]|nr:MAG: PDZ domain-containing protein [Actinomycetota bacterium]